MQRSEGVALGRMKSGLSLGSETQFNCQNTDLEQAVKFKSKGQNITEELKDSLGYLWTCWYHTVQQRLEHKRYQIRCPLLEDRCQKVRHKFMQRKNDDGARLMHTCKHTGHQQCLVTAAASSASHPPLPSRPVPSHPPPRLSPLCWESSLCTQATG